MRKLAGRRQGGRLADQRQKDDNLKTRRLTKGFSAAMTVALILVVLAFRGSSRKWILDRLQGKPVAKNGHLVAELLSHGYLTSLLALGGLVGLYRVVSTLTQSSRTGAPLYLAFTSWPSRIARLLADSRLRSIQVSPLLTNDSSHVMDICKSQRVEERTAKAARQSSWKQEMPEAANLLPWNWNWGLPVVSSLYPADQELALVVRCFSNGNRYEGQAEMGGGECMPGKMSGHGVYLFAGGGRYEGEWVAGRQEGVGTEIWGGRGWKYGGEYRAGQRDGKGVCEWGNGDSYAGQWARGHSHGVGVRVCADGSRYCGDFGRGARHGLGVYSFCNGDRYEGEYFGDRMHGFGVYHFANGHRYEGAWHHGQKQGLGAYTFNSGEQRAGQWHLGALQKPAKTAGLGPSEGADNQAAASRPSDADETAVGEGGSTGCTVDLRRSESEGHRPTVVAPASQASADTDMSQRVSLTVRHRIGVSQQQGEATMRQGAATPVSRDSSPCAVTAVVAHDACSIVEASSRLAPHTGANAGGTAVVGTTLGAVHCVQQAGNGGGGVGEGGGAYTAVTTHAGGPPVKPQLCVSGTSNEQSSRLSRSSSTDSCGSSCDSTHSTNSNSDAQSSATQMGTASLLSPDPLHRKGMVPPFELSRLPGAASGGFSGALRSPPLSGGGPFLALRSFSSVDPSSRGSYDGAAAAATAAASGGGSAGGSGFGFTSGFGHPVEQVVDQGRVEEAVEAARRAARRARAVAQIDQDVAMAVAEANQAAAVARKMAARALQRWS